MRKGKELSAFFSATSWMAIIMLGESSLRSELSSTPI
jgi:hypothetical protein